jgi:SAM-dependent methyltransferase
MESDNRQRRTSGIIDSMKQHNGKVRKRRAAQKGVDCILFPARALLMIERDAAWLSSIASDRFYYAAGRVQGYCLDVGCGRHNRFVTEFLGGNGRGIDVYPYEGLTAEHVIEDMSHFPFEDGSFDTVTFLANINHVPEPMRDIELAEAFRCLRKGGNIVVTMGNPVAEVLVHKLVWLYDKLLGTKFDMDNLRGMHDSEHYYLLDSEIRERLMRAGFSNIRKEYFVTQWFLNHMLIGWKKG